MQKYAVETFDLTKVYEVRKKLEHGFIKRLRAVKGTIRAVDHFNVKIRDGELFGLLGPNGAGKTTLIKMLCTLLIPTEGGARVNGFDVLKEEREVRRSIGVVFTGERSVYWKLTGRENLEYFSRLYYLSKSQAQKRIDELLKGIGLDERADDYVEKYSSGMRQKLAMISALIHNPPILFLDEPTLGLDPSSARNVRDIIKELNKEGRTILLTTHYMLEADELCDRVGIIHEGKLIACDKPSRLKASLKHESVIEIQANHLNREHESELKRSFPEVENIVVVIEDPIIGEGTIKIIGSEAEDSLPRILEKLLSQNVDVRGVNVAEPTLEDVFINLTAKPLRT